MPRLPDIQLEHTEERPLGKYGRMCRAYLQENHTLLYNHLILTGKLFPYLWEIQEAATSRMEQIMVGLLEAHSDPGTKRPIRWCGQDMNALRAVAGETISAELITC